MVEKLGNMRAVSRLTYIPFEPDLLSQLNMTSAEDYIVNNTREVVPGLITGGMELSGKDWPSVDANSQNSMAPTGWVPLSEACSLRASRYYNSAYGPSLTSSGCERGSQTSRFVQDCRWRGRGRQRVCIDCLECKFATEPCLPCQWLMTVSSRNRAISSARLDARALGSTGAHPGCESPPRRVKTMAVCAHWDRPRRPLQSSLAASTSESDILSPNFSKRSLVSLLVDPCRRIRIEDGLDIKVNVLLTAVNALIL